GVEVAIEALLAGRAESAVERAARLARDAQSAAVGFGDEDRLDRVRFIHLQQPLSRAILGSRVADDDGRVDTRRRDELFPQRLRQVAHAGEVGLALLVDPAQELARAE